MDEMEGLADPEKDHMDEVFGIKTSRCRNFALDGSAKLVKSAVGDDGDGDGGDGDDGADDGVERCACCGHRVHFEMVGADYMLDQDFNAWLLEVDLPLFRNRNVLGRV